jgi:hypothetical protein
MRPLNFARSSTGARCIARHGDRGKFRAEPRLLVPSGPPVRQVESYPLGDYLYDRSKAKDDLISANMRWIWYKEGLPQAERELVESVERIGRKIVKNSS